LWSIGGDGGAHHIALEAERLRGFPPPPDDEEGDDSELEDETGAEASP
jgi:hypothetical protein